LIGLNTKPEPWTKKPKKTAVSFTDFRSNLKSVNCK
jgi:hypothetical protein